jgi:hypothetical protein
VVRAIMADLKWGRMSECTPKSKPYQKHEQKFDQISN